MTKIKHSILIFVVIYSTTAYDCVPGEKWQENCKECTCFRNGSFDCLPGSCLDDQCVPGSVWFNEKNRCHCGVPGSRPHTVCVKMQRQRGLNNMPCEPVGYLYDTCNWCACNPTTNRTKCYHYKNCWKTTGGVCTPGSINIEEGCFKCRCTHTRFRICTYENACGTLQVKKGSCNLKNSYESPNNYLCIFLKQQECYSDYGCPGDKKCCHVEECYFRCVDPVFN